MIILLIIATNPNTNSGFVSVNNVSVITSTLQQQIIDAYDNDDITKEILKVGKRQLRNRTDQHITVKNGKIWFDNTRIYVPNNDVIQTLLISEHHDGKINAHLGVAKTIEALERNYYWPNLRAQVKLYIKTCLTCQRIKPTNKKKAGLLQPLPIPETRWN